MCIVFYKTQEAEDIRIIQINLRMSEDGSRVVHMERLVVRWLPLDGPSDSIQLHFTKHGKIGIIRII